MPEPSENKKKANTSFNENQFREWLSRIDERVKMLTEQQNDLEEKFSEFKTLHFTSLWGKDTQVESNNKIKELMEKVQSLEKDSDSKKNLFNMVIDIVFRLVLMVAGGYILYKLGLQSPPG